MSWQSQWGTVKAANARAAALYYEVSNVGKTIESSKKRVVWRLKVEEGREFEISLTHSLASGKKVLRVDGIVNFCASDLIVDGMSFRRLPERLDPTKFQKPQGNVVTSAIRTTSNGGSGSRNSSFTYNYSNGGYGNRSNGGSRNSSRESSFGPWECTRCTLVNEKPLAPVCEACGHPKPDYISSSPTPSPTASRPAAKSAAEPPILFDMWQNAPAATSTSSAAFPAFTDSDGFPVSSMSTVPATMPSMTAKQPFQQDITSMLSGLDFTPAPVEETSPPVETTLEPSPTEEEKTAGDLWSSDMVNLNLKPEEKNPVQRSAKSYQTLEQARQLAPKEKVQVLPTPSPLAFPTYNAAPAPAAFYGGMPQAQPMMYNTVGNPGAFGMAPAPMSYGAPQANPMATYGGFGGQQQPSPFMTAAPMNAPPRQSSMQNFSNDPFATLS
ncbi:unnamed protein product [Phytophthora lilii]|uniref:Unnamed protein product n=1 Tax=Phytophthora lilii TaxID=2077276 RepID=A0A9W6TA11_9STRA|nr:unnamed protein product [Phytophthora lilii]